MIAAIELKFYGEDDSVTATYACSRVKTKFLKTSIALARELGDAKDLSEEQVNALLDFIVDLFGNKFTRQELEEQTDLFECVTTLKAVFARANSLAAQQAKANPTIPPPLQKRT